MFAIEPNSQVRERELPAGVRVLLSIKAKETPALELPMKGAFQPWGIHILWGLQTDRRGPPFVAGAKSQSNQTCGRLGVEMRVRREEKRRGSQLGVLSPSQWLTHPKDTFLEFLLFTGTDLNNCDFKKKVRKKEKKWKIKENSNFGHSPLGEVKPTFTH